MLGKVLKDLAIYSAAALACFAMFQNREALYELAGLTPPSVQNERALETQREGQTGIASQPDLPQVQNISGGTVSIPKSPDGHFWTQGRVNSGSVKFLVDTGASVIALTPEDAKRAGFKLLDLDYSVTVNTANGQTQAARITLRDVAIGTVVLRDVEAVVVEQGLSHSLLGMSYLGRLQKVEASPSQLLLRL